VASSAAYARERERVLRICDAAGEARTLRLELLEAISRVVGFDAYAWLVTDPETSVGCAPLADVPCLAQLPELIRLKYLTTVNRWTALRGNVAQPRRTALTGAGNMKPRHPRRLPQPPGRGAGPAWAPARARCGMRRERVHTGTARTPT